MVKSKEQKSNPLENAEISLKMMGDRILIVPSNEDGERATRGGLVIPATANSDRLLRWGQVVSIGPNTRIVQVDERVLYSPESGYEVEISGETYLVLRERDIHAAAQTGGNNAPGLYL